MSEHRPRVTGYFLEPDEESRPLLVAIGRAVMGAAALEKVLLLEIARVRAESEGLTPELGDELSRLEGLSAGVLHKTLRALELPDDLDARIADAIKRRNQLVHHPMEDPDLVRAATAGEDVAPVVERIDRLALDCGELAVELQMVASPRLEAVLGKSPPEMLEMLREADLDAIEDPDLRRQVEAIRAAGDLEWPPPEPPVSNA
jgi:hypothetical protein